MKRDLNFVTELIEACPKAQGENGNGSEPPTQLSELDVFHAVHLASDARQLQLRAHNGRQEWAIAFNQFMDHLWADISRHLLNTSREVGCLISSVLSRCRGIPLISLCRFMPQFYAHRAVEADYAEVEHDDGKPIRYLTPDVVLSALAYAPFRPSEALRAANITEQRMAAWGSEFSAEVTESDGTGRWEGVKLPVLIVEHVTDDKTDHRGHRAMAMKSALAVYRMYKLSDEVVFGLLVDRGSVSLSFAWVANQAEAVDVQVRLHRSSDIHDVL